MCILLGHFVLDNLKQSYTLWENVKNFNLGNTY